MATDRTFSSMLNEWLTYDLLRTEFEKRMYFMDKVQKDNNWKGGTLPVPFVGAEPTSASFGSLTSASDVAELDPVRGEVTSQPEIWSTLYFNHRDFEETDGTTKAQNFLRSLKGQLPRMLDYTKTIMSLQFLAGPHFAILTAAGTSGGLITVDRPELFSKGQKIITALVGTRNSVGYVDTVNMETNVIHVVTARGGAVDDDLSAMVAGDKVYHDGLVNAGTSALQNNMTSLRSSLLSSANGGGASLYGQTKTDYPFLQAINEDGSAINATNILEQVFDAYVEIDRKSPGNPTEVVMSYKNFGSCMKAIDIQKGAYNVTPGSASTSKYKWRTIEIGSPSGHILRLVAVPEMVDTDILFMDWSSVKLHSNGMFKFRQNPESGDRFYEVRATTGYYYLVDISFFGDMILSKPSQNGILHSISY